MNFFARDVSDMGYQPGVILWLAYFRSLHICKHYHIYAKYMINIVKHLDDRFISQRGEV